MDPNKATNEMESTSSQALCKDSESYRNPLNGYSCFEHKDESCWYWLDVLESEQLADLLTNCPESCNNLELECLNATDAKLLHLNPVAATSYSNDSTANATSTDGNNLASIAILSAIGVVSMIFVGLRYIVSRDRGSTTRKDCLVDEEDPPESRDCNGKSSAQEQPKVISHIICNDNDESIASPAGQPTPRLIPDLNICSSADDISKDSSDGSENDCDYSTHQSVISFGNIMMLPSNEESVKSRFEDTNQQSSGILSPSTSIVHLLGAMRSYDETSDLESMM